ncbi:MAG: cobalamin-binding protein [Syntrophomonadaceae bacterium]
MRKRPALLVIIALCLFGLISGCRGGAGQTQAPAASNNNSFPVKVTDDRGRQVDIAAKPLRLVSLVPGFTETLFAMGLGDRLVGVTAYCDYPSEAQAKPKIGGFSNPSLEKIVEAKPDLVLATGMHSQLVEQLEAMNFKVLVYSPHNMDGLMATITSIGIACGEHDQARALNASLMQRLDAVKAKLADLPSENRPLVFYEVWHEPLMTVGPNTLISDIISQAGGRCLTATGREDYPTISDEFIIEKNPDIMVHSYGTGMNNTPTREVILGRKGWQGVNFIKNQRIMGVDSNLITRPGPRLVDAIEQLARGFYPDRFQ